MELKQIKDLMVAMGRNGTKKMTLKKEGFELTLERGEGSTPYMQFLPEGAEENPLRADMDEHRAHAFLKNAATHAAPPVAQSHSVAAPAKTDDPKALFITSPMVGTFYAATAPDDPPFVKVGDRVEKSTVVCIVEAMKVMNEVKAGMSGTIVEVLIENGQPIEFGSKLFRVSL